MPKQHPETQEDKDDLEKLSVLRQSIYMILESINEWCSGEDMPACIEELMLAKRELQSARHWLGECKSFYPNDFIPSDIPPKI